MHYLVISIRHQIDMHLFRLSDKHFDRKRNSLAEQSNLHFRLSNLNRPRIKVNVIWIRGDT